MKNKKFLLGFVLIFSVTVLGIGIYKIKVNNLKPIAKQSSLANLPFELPEDIPPYPNMEWKGVTYGHDYNTSVAIYGYSCSDKISNVIDFYSKNSFGNNCKLEKVSVENKPIIGPITISIYRCGKKRYYIGIRENKNRTLISIAETSVLPEIIADKNAQ